MYDSSLKYRWDNQNVLEYAVTTAVATAEVKAEHKKALDIARELKNEGLPISQIEKFTKLSANDIEKL